MKKVLLSALLLSGITTTSFANNANDADGKADCLDLKQQAIANIDSAMDLIDALSDGGSSDAPRYADLQTKLGKSTQIANTVEALEMSKTGQKDLVSSVNLTVAHAQHIMKTGVSFENSLLKLSKQNCESEKSQMAVGLTYTISENAILDICWRAVSVLQKSFVTSNSAREKIIPPFRKLQTQAHKLMKNRNLIIDCVVEKDADVIQMIGN